MTRVEELKQLVANMPPGGGFAHVSFDFLRELLAEVDGAQSAEMISRLSQRASGADRQIELLTKQVSALTKTLSVANGFGSTGER